MNLLVSFSAWAELVWQYLLEVRITVTRVRSADRSRVNTKNLTLTLTLTVTLNLTLTETLTLTLSTLSPGWDAWSGGHNVGLRGCAMICVMLVLLHVAAPSISCLVLNSVASEPPHIHTVDKSI